MAGGGFIQGNKLSLNTLTREDLPAYRSWIENARATCFMETGWRPPSDAEMDALYAASTEQNETVVLTIVPEKLQRPVGVCGLYLIQWICRRAEFRILIGDDEGRGHGYGTEAAKLMLTYAFDRLNLESVHLGVNIENKAAIGSYEKAGFRREGIRRKLVYRNGRYYDVLMMSVLREEWLSNGTAQG